MRKRRGFLLAADRQHALQMRKGRGGLVDESEQVEVLRANDLMTHQRLEIDDLVPIAFAIQQDRYFALELFCLCQGDDLDHFIERAETPWKNNQRLGKVSEP